MKVVNTRAQRLNHLVGRADRPGLSPAPEIVSRLADLGNELAAAGGQVLDPLDLILERADLLGFSRAGANSCGGACRLLPTLDGWIAVSLARQPDRDLVPAWLECDDIDEHDDVWVTVGDSLIGCTKAHIVERARLVGLAVSVVGETRLDGRPPVLKTVRTARRPRATPVVVDLSSLWAGPLCGRILGQSGCRVIKVESTARPDGARGGSRELFESLNDQKQCVSIDFGTSAGRSHLARLFDDADVVIEASRPRALRHLGLGPATSSAAVWVSITGHGRVPPADNWVAFGDDAAASAGLVAWDGDGPCFVGDAMADPLAGITAATAVLSALAAGGGVLLDVALSRSAAQLVSP